MKISGIDEDFINIIDYLDKTGFRPYASCDGVLEHHTDPKTVHNAYISFLKSPQIIELMATFFRDNERFKIVFNNSSDTNPYNLYGNLITGNTYSVYFPNENGELTSYFEKTIMQATRENVTTSEGQKLNKLSNILEDDKGSNLHFGVSLNSQYQPYMRKEGRINVLRVETKEGCGYYRDMNVLANMIFEKFGTIRKKDDLDEVFNETEFSVTTSMNSMCEIYFTDEHFEQMLDMINYIKSVEHTLPTFPKKEMDEYWEDYYEELELLQMEEDTEREEQDTISENRIKRFGKNDVKKLAESRLITRIKKMYLNLKEKFKYNKKDVPENIMEGYSKDE